MKIVIVGAGYVGLVSGACLADFGHSVVCVDKDKKKIAALENGQVPIYEPGLGKLIETNISQGRLSFTNHLAEAMVDAQVIFIAVGTPSRRGDGFADLQFVYAVADEIAEHMKTPITIVMKSTVPVGTGDEVERRLSARQPDVKFDIVSNPEFLREGAAIEDFKRPDRVVVGAKTSAAMDVMKEVYRPLFLNQTPMHFTNRKTSELIKYASNAFLATKIAFINEIADLCEVVGADVQGVAHGIGLDKRIGSKFLNAGPGYGGSCFPKDTVALLQTADAAGVDLSIVNAVVNSNTKRKDGLHLRVVEAAGGDLNGLTIAVLGLSFKPNTNDMRYSPSIPMIANIQKLGGRVRAYDPEAMEEAAEIFEDVIFSPDAYTCAADADVLVIVTEWDQFRAFDFKRLKDVVKRPILVDLRNIYERDDVENFGFSYHDIG
jgi:UDPglucose 6-dehydrogenase